MPCSTYEGIWRQARQGERRYWPQRASPFQSPFLRHFPFPKHALSPGWAWKFPCYRKGSQIRVAGAVPEYCAKMHSPGPVLSKAGDLSDFPARRKSLKKLDKFSRTASEVGDFYGGRRVTESGKSLPPLPHQFIEFTPRPRNHPAWIRAPASARRHPTKRHPWHRRQTATLSFQP
jgi:hypothetical protein